MQILDSEFISIEIAENAPFLKATWKPASEDMDDKYFQTINLTYVELAQKHTLQGLCIDIQHFTYTIHPDIQEWVANEILPQLINLGIKRIAFNVSQDMIAQLSVEQTMEENTEIPLQVFYFSEISEAEAWLKKT